VRGTLAEESLTGADDGLCTSADVRALYVEHAASLRLTLSRLGGPLVDPDDLLQEVFVVAMRNCDALSRVQSRRAWLYGVATKVAATRRRGARLRQALGLDVGEAHAAPESPHRTLEQREASLHVQRILGSLSEPKRSVFVLYELQGLKGEEIAEALSIPLKTVWTRLFHARREFEKEAQRLELIETSRSAR
jgi:RNA polymerase sigma-70 factor, ECF subfamily